MLNNLDVGRQIIDELIRHGVTKFIISPGSRSTPLTVAVARNSRADRTVHYDERGAAFFALGYAKATDIPTVLICTSGTAVANYFPAIVEASMDNIPLIVLTADRPPELIGVGANQAIFQENIFGEYPRLYSNLPPATPDTSLSEITDQVQKMVKTSLGLRPGPVHLNCQFREPLLPQKSMTDQNKDSTIMQESASPSRFKPRGVPEDLVQRISRELGEKNKSLIIVGRSVDMDDTNAILKLSESLGLPIFADVQSTLRFSAHPNIINYFDLALLKHELDTWKPDLILHFGGPYTSKRLLQYIDTPDVFYVSVKTTPGSVDPNGHLKLEIVGNISDLCAQLGACAYSPDTEWLSIWQAVNGQISDLVNAEFSGLDNLTEPHISNVLSKIIPNNHTLVVANSMAVREMEMFGATGGINGRVHANRGSSGIDGLLATSAGLSDGAGSPVTLIIGDLAMLHDLNSLQLIKMSNYPVTVVVINNDGGGIFNFLPVSEETDIFESYFGTPHGLSCEHVARMFRINYANPKNMDAFETTYTQAVQNADSCIIEVKTERAANHQYHQQIFNRIRESK